MEIDGLLAQLQAYQSDNAFNQYRDTHPELDQPGAPCIRRRNLGIYLRAFRDTRHILVGEAAGYAGCRFSGIPFTCEAQLAGTRRLSWAHSGALAPSSRADTLWVERSATIVWQALEGRTDCLLWNAFPWHPYGVSGPLSNQSPGRALADGLEVLAGLLRLFPRASPLAVGRVAQRALAALGIDAPYIRHPSHGGKQAFMAGVAALPRGGGK